MNNSNNALEIKTDLRDLNLLCHGYFLREGYLFKKEEIIKSEVEGKKKKIKEYSLTYIELKKKYNNDVYMLKGKSNYFVYYKDEDFSKIDEEDKIEMLEEEYSLFFQDFEEAVEDTYNYLYGRDLEIFNYSESNLTSKLLSVFFAHKKQSELKAYSGDSKIRQIENLSGFGANFVIENKSKSDNLNKYFHSFALTIEDIGEKNYCCLKISTSVYKKIKVTSFNKDVCNIRYSKKKGLDNKEYSTKKDIFEFNEGHEELSSLKKLLSKPDEDSSYYIKVDGRDKDKRVPLFGGISASKRKEENEIKQSGKVNNLVLDINKKSKAHYHSMFMEDFILSIEDLGVIIKKANIPFKPHQIDKKNGIDLMENNLSKIFFLMSGEEADEDPVFLNKFVLKDTAYFDTLNGVFKNTLYPSIYSYNDNCCSKKHDLLFKEKLKKELSDLRDKTNLLKKTKKEKGLSESDQLNIDNKLDKLKKEKREVPEMVAKTFCNDCYDNIMSFKNNELSLATKNGSKLALFFTPLKVALKKHFNAEAIYITKKKYLEIKEENKTPIVFLSVTNKKLSFEESNSKTNNELFKHKIKRYGKGDLYLKLKQSTKSLNLHFAAQGMELSKAFGFYENKTGLSTNNDATFIMKELLCKSLLVKGEDIKIKNINEDFEVIYCHTHKENKGKKVFIITMNFKYKGKDTFETNYSYSTKIDDGLERLLLSKNVRIRSEDLILKKGDNISILTSTYALSPRINDIEALTGIKGVRAVDSETEKFITNKTAKSSKKITDVKYDIMISKMEKKEIVFFNSKTIAPSGDKIDNLPSYYKLKSVKGSFQEIIPLFLNTFPLLFKVEGNKIEGSISPLISKFPVFKKLANEIINMKKGV